VMVVEGASNSVPPVVEVEVEEPLVARRAELRVMRGISIFCSFFFNQ